MEPIRYINSDHHPPPLPYTIKASVLSFSFWEPLDRSRSIFTWVGACGRPSRPPHFTRPSKEPFEGSTTSKNRGMEVQSPARRGYHRFAIRPPDLRPADLRPAGLPGPGFVLPAQICCRMRWSNRKFMNSRPISRSRHSKLGGQTIGALKSG